jgi:hypothetical protein
MRAAFMRQYYPGTIFASYASSAPVQAAVDMSFYFDPVWKGMRALGWSNCTEDIKAAVRAMDVIMETPLLSFRLKEKFLGPGAGKNTNAGFADALSTIFFLWQSYGVDGGKQGLRSLCNHLSTDPATNKTSDAKGWAAVKGPEFTINRWATWPSFAAAVNENLFTNCQGFVKPKNQTKEIDCDLQERFPEPAAISWTWQYCTQWGFLQSANLGEHQLVSRYNSLEHQHDICHRQFPDGIESGLLPDWPPAAETNRRFGGWAIRPSNTFWTGGEFDPWRTLSTLSDMPFSPKYKTVQTIPECATSSGEKEQLFGYLVPDGIHAYDFRTNFNGSIPARKLFTEALTKWLGCWKPTDRGVTVDTGGSWGEGHFAPGGSTYGIDGVKRANYP